MSWATEDAELFTDMLAEFGVVGGLIFANRARDIVAGPKVVSFVMEGNNYVRQIARELIGLRADNTDLIDLWKASTPTNRPVATLVMERVQLTEFTDDEPGATVKFLARLLQ